MYACDGTFSGGMEDSSTEAICNIDDGYHVCRSAIEAYKDGLTYSACSSLPGDSMYFAQETSNAEAACYSDSTDNLNKTTGQRNDIWGCGGTDFYGCRSDHPCYSTLSTFCTGYVDNPGIYLGSDDAYEYDNVEITNKSRGGVLCCPTSTPTDIPTTIPTMIPSSHPTLNTSSVREHIFSSHVSYQPSSQISSDTPSVQPHVSSVDNDNSSNTGTLMLALVIIILFLTFCAIIVISIICIKGLHKKREFDIKQKQIELDILKQQNLNIKENNNNINKKHAQLSNYKLNGIVNLRATHNTINADSDKMIQGESDVHIVPVAETMNDDNADNINNNIEGQFDKIPDIKQAEIDVAAIATS